MGGSIFTNSNRVVGEDVGHTAKLGKGGNTDGGAEVINEDREGGSRGLEDSVVSNTVKDGSHGVLTDTEVHVLSVVGLVKSSSEVSTVVDVVTGGSVKIGGTRDVVRNQLGNVLDDLVSRHTGGLSIAAHLGDGLDHLSSRHDIVSNSILELLCQIGIGLLPGSVGGLPIIVDLAILRLDTVEVITGSLGNKPLLSLGKADGGLGTVNVWDTSLSMGGVGSLSLFHALTNDGVALDELGLSVVGGLGSGDGLLDSGEVMSIDFIGLETVGVITLDDVLGLGVFSHFVKGDLIGIVKDDQVVKLLLSGEGSRLSRDTLLEASISSKGVDVVIKDLVVVSVVTGGGHLLGNGKTNSVGHTGTKGSSCALNSGGVVLGVGEFGVAGCLGMVLTEVLQLLDGEIKSGKVEP
mmetsp:Transcript_25519/g.54906  ORF Transcript_25519/g.54906 Transcript_25519/m.54906 type:complete len:407 (-) Transcript_25519:456-1676(-)